MVVKKTVNLAAILLVLANVLFASCGEYLLRELGRKEELSATIDYQLPAKMRLTPEIVIDHSAYRVSFNTTTLCPNYVAWRLTKEKVNGSVSRTDKFKPDPSLPQECQVVTSDYSNSGNDRGHMCPAADNKDTEVHMKESFYMSNICPQSHKLNAGDWEELEEQCRSWVKNYSDLYIVCGPIFDSSKPKRIEKPGRPSIMIPDRFFKVILMLGRTPKMLGFIYPNENKNLDMREYCVSVDEVEQITGIDFYYTLPDGIERQLEASCNPADWGI